MLKLKSGKNSILAFLIFVLAPTTLRAEQFGLEFFDLVLKKDFVLGMFTGLVVHEGGHYIAAKMQGHDLSFRNLSLGYTNEAGVSDFQRHRMNIAGFGSQWVASEWAFYQLEQTNRSKIESLTSTDFLKGIIATHLLISLAYASILYNNEDGDIKGFYYYSGVSQSYITASIMLPAMLDYWRLSSSDPPNWVPLFSMLSKSLGIAYMCSI